METGAQRAVTGPSFYGSLAAYDRLPRPIRDQLKQAQANWACQVLEKFIADGCSVEFVIEALKHRDQEEIEAVRQHERSWGLDRTDVAP